jgi:CHAT domain-containing protein
LPFEAFTTSLGDTTNISYWNLPYLCRDYTINYAYSLNILSRNLSEKPNKKKNKILGMSYSSFYEDDDADIAQLRFENELPFSGQEIQQIGEIFKHAGFQTYAEATESQFKELASDYAIIHLAIHGQADSIDKFNSKLLFKTTQGAGEDGQLHAYELYNIDLSGNQLAVLSACETGLGKQVEGEGMFSIARGFAYAGCPSIVMSLWKVNDKATSILMKYFYENLAAGDTKDQALQKAKLSYIQNSDDFNAHPANWAAFIALGNNQPVDIQSSDTLIYFGLAIILALMIAGYFYFRKN